MRGGGYVTRAFDHRPEVIILILATLVLAAENRPFHGPWPSQHTVSRILEQLGWRLGYSRRRYRRSTSEPDLRSAASQPIPNFAHRSITEQQKALATEHERSSCLRVLVFAVF